MKKTLVISLQSLNNNESAGGVGKLGYLLAKELNTQNRLKEFVVSSKGKFRTDLRSSPVSFLSRYYLLILNKSAELLRMKSYQKRYWEERLFDFFCQFKITSDIDTIITTNPYLYYTLKKAKKAGIYTVFIPGNPEDNFVYDIVLREKIKYGDKNIDAYTYKPRLDYYNASLRFIDKIMTYSTLMYETYKKEHPNRNIELVKGMLRPAFCNRPARFKDEKFIVKYLAYTVLLKGLQYLIQAWREIDLKDSILEIGGPIEDSVFKLIKHDLDSTQNIVFSGTVTDKEAFFSNASLFVLPSIIDGAPVVVLEAMMAGVPVIITENCGNKDFVSEGYTGFIIPIADVDSLKTKIKYCYEHRNKLSEMGERCHKIISEFDTNEFTRDLLDHINKGEENIH